MALLLESGGDICIHVRELPRVISISRNTSLYDKTFQSHKELYMTKKTRSIEKRSNSSIVRCDEKLLLTKEMQEYQDGVLDMNMHLMKLEDRTKRTDGYQT